MALERKYILCASIWTILVLQFLFCVGSRIDKIKKFSPEAKHFKNHRSRVFPLIIKMYSLMKLNSNKLLKSSMQPLKYEFINNVVRTLHRVWNMNIYISRTHAMVTSLECFHLNFKSGKKKIMRAISLLNNFANPLYQLNTRITMPPV